jgi:hypothetical protein
MVKGTQSARRSAEFAEMTMSVLCEFCLVHRQYAEIARAMVFYV